MNFPIVTARFAAVLAILQIALMMWVVLSRNQSKIGIGDGGNEVLARRIRVHGNLTENIPIFLILLGLLEASGIDRTPVIALGSIFILARSCHAAGLSRSSGPHPLRIAGAVGTNFCIATAAGMLLWRTFGGAIA